jgi:hypothetical protein
MMMKRIIWIMALLLAIVACSFSLGNPGPTGDTSNQPTSAQSFLPDVSGYTRSNADSLTDAITAIGGGASLISGNPALAAGIAKIDDMIQCYQNVGAVAANIYTQADLGQILAGQTPSVGALAVINEDRLSRNFLNCALGGSDSFSSQAVTIEPCFGSGSLTANNETIHYIYAATTPGLCNSFQIHFDSLS